MENLNIQMSHLKHHTDRVLGRAFVYRNVFEDYHQDNIDFKIFHNLSQKLLHTHDILMFGFQQFRG